MMSVPRTKKTAEIRDKKGEDKFRLKTANMQSKRRTRRGKPGQGGTKYPVAMPPIRARVG